MCSFASIRSALHHVLDLEPCTVIHIPPSLWIVVLYTYYCIEYICRLYMFALPCTSCMLFSHFRRFCYLWCPYIPNAAALREHVSRDSSGNCRSCERSHRECSIIYCVVHLREHAKELLWAVKNGNVDAVKKHLERVSPTCARREAGDEKERREASSSGSAHHIAETRTW